MAALAISCSCGSGAASGMAKSASAVTLLARYRMNPSRLRRIRRRIRCRGRLRRTIRRGAEEAPIIPAPNNAVPATATTTSPAATRLQPSAQNIGVFLPSPPSALPDAGHYLLHKPLRSAILQPQLRAADHDFARLLIKSPASRTIRHVALHRQLLRAFQRTVQIRIYGLIKCLAVLITRSFHFFLTQGWLKSSPPAYNNLRRARRPRLMRDFTVFRLVWTAPATSS